MPRLRRLTCAKCAWTWRPLKVMPRRCPNCVGDWRVPYKYKTYAGAPHEVTGRHREGHSAAWLALYGEGSLRPPRKLRKREVGRMHEKREMRTRRDQYGDRLLFRLPCSCGWSGLEYRDEQRAELAFLRHQRRAKARAEGYGSEEVVVG